MQKYLVRDLAFLIIFSMFLPRRSYYSPGLATLHFNSNLGDPISMAPMEVVIDSGSTFTYMPTETYRRLVWTVGCESHTGHY